LKRFFEITVIVSFVLCFFLVDQAFPGKITGAIKVKGLRSPANILVYLSKAPPLSVDLSRARFVMDQRNLTFIPHILPIFVGTTVHFPNNDKVKHNVFSLSRAKKFNLGSYEQGETKRVLFDRPGIVELRCDVHAEMAAYILVLKNPYFAITDDKGRFEIPDSKYLETHGIRDLKDLPPGKYSVKAWHEKLKTRKVTVHVPKEGQVSVQLDLTRGTPGVLYK
jgi:plastocyanin